MLYGVTSGASRPSYLEVTSCLYVVQSVFNVYLCSTPSDTKFIKSLNVLIIYICILRVRQYPKWSAKDWVIGKGIVPRWFCVFDFRCWREHADPLALFKSLSSRVLCVCCLVLLMPNFYQCRGKHIISLNFLLVYIDRSFDVGRLLNCFIKLYEEPDLQFHFILFSHFHENNIVKFQVMYIVCAIWITT